MKELTNNYKAYLLNKSDIEQALKNYYGANDVCVYIAVDSWYGNDTVEAEIRIPLKKEN